jgi:hypothetical protein
MARARVSRCPGRVDARVLASRRCLMRPTVSSAVASMTQVGPRRVRTNSCIAPVALPDVSCSLSKVALSGWL